MRRRHPTHSDAASSRDFFGLKKFRSRPYYAGVVQRLVFRSSKPRMGCRNPSLAPYAGVPKWLKGAALKAARGVKTRERSNRSTGAASQRSLHVAMLFSLILYIRSVSQAAKTLVFHARGRVSITLRSTIGLTVKSWSTVLRRLILKIPAGLQFCKRT